jgi:hypothetical protein
MSPPPAGWEEASSNSQIDECIPLFLETDRRHYRKMNRAYCRDKIDTACMWIWRQTDIDWTHPGTVRNDGLALAFHLWRPRYSNHRAIEHRFCLCLFLGNTLTTPGTLIGPLKTAVTAFADQQAGRDRFFLVKQARYDYPARVDAVFNSILARLQQHPDAPAEQGWPERNVWRIVDWT